MNETLEISGLMGYEAETTATMPMECYHTMCAWCGKSKGKSGGWFHSHVTASELTTHGICPDCLNVMKEELNSYRALHHAPVSQSA